ncbi:porin family protein [Alphaproteobacteria bacterium]|nr:porin family protein [PS1 clade bacterium]MBL6784205.1 porin family protein [PS1 clade bacterium]MDB2522748.1 porin family protein [Alphaproteobacteria bacterium]
MRILFFAISFLAMPLGAAQAQNYVGISGGLMTYEANDTEIDSQGFTIVAGGQFDPILAVEFSYSAHSSVEVAGADYKASVMALSGVLRSPGEGFEPFLRLGIARGDSDIAGSEDDGTEDGFIFGIGADFSLNYNSSLRLEYGQTDLGDAESDRLSFGTIYRF